MRASLRKRRAEKAEGKIRQASGYNSVKLISGRNGAIKVQESIDKCSTSSNLASMLVTKHISKLPCQTHCKRHLTTNPGIKVKCIFKIKNVCVITRNDFLFFLPESFLFSYPNLSFFLTRIFLFFLRETFFSHASV